MLHPAPLRRFISIVIAGVLIGALYGDVHHGAPGIGATVGGSIGAALFALERFVLRRNAGGFLGRLPFLPYLALRSLLYAGVILIINTIADRLMSGQFMVVGSIDFLLSLALVAAGNLLFSVNDLLGPGTLFAFAAGATMSRASRSGRSCSSTGAPRLRSRSAWASSLSEPAQPLHRRSFARHRRSRGLFCRSRPTS